MGKPLVMVAVRDADTVESLMALASQLSRGMNGELAALHVVQVPLPTPLDAENQSLDQHGKEVLAQAQQLAAKLSEPLSIELLRARDVSEAIVGVARERGVELLVMGHHKPHPHAISEAFLGGIVRYVAHHAPCRVIVQIPAPEHK